MHATAHRRSAFTLVEMLVSTALIMFMMYIIAAAFEKGIESFRVMKTAGDLQDRLRSAGTIVRQDLCRQHFGSQLLLSDQRLEQKDWRINMPSDEGGYFRIYQSDESLANTTIEGADPDNLSLIMTRSTGTKHVLQFTVRLRPDEYRRDQFFTTDTQIPLGTNPNFLCNFSVPDYMRPAVPGPVPSDPQDPSLPHVFASRWAEVSYFLRDSGQTTPGNTPLYGLYRRQQLLIEPKGTNSPSLAGANANQMAELSTWRPAGPPRPNGPKDVSVPARRFGVTTGALPPTSSLLAGIYPSVASGPTLDTFQSQFGPGSIQQGGDLLLSDVVSFEIKAMWDIPTDTKVFRVVSPPQPNGNADYPFDYLPMGMNPVFNDPRVNARVFDTWTQEKASLAGLSYNYLDGPGNSKDDPTWNVGQFVTDNRAAGATTIPLRVRMRAVQIKLRIWDVKSQQTRQLTIIQDL